MKNEDMKINEEKINKAFNSNLKIHIDLRDGSWRNGYIKEISADFFMFEDMVNGEEPIFFLELKKVEPYLNKKEGENA